MSPADRALVEAALAAGHIEARVLAQLVREMTATSAPTSMAERLISGGHVPREQMPALQRRAEALAEHKIGTLDYGESERALSDATAIDARPTHTTPDLARSNTQALRSLGLDPDRFERRYVLGEELGRGGAGRVLTASDRLLGRTVAIKILHDVEASAPKLLRFLSEAQTTGQLEHPNVVPVHDMGLMPNGAPYFAMKHVRGRSLKDLIETLRREPERGARDGTLSRYKLLQIFTQVCMGVEYAHSEGVLHRDLKPDNVMVGDFGEVFVMDWGIAKLRRLRLTEERDDDPTLREFDIAQTAEHTLTQAGAIFGTPGYMSPEQARGDMAKVDVRTDVWGLGAILYELLTWQRPVAGATMLATLMLTSEHDVVPPRERAPQRDVPLDLDEICQRALARDRDARYPTVRALHDEVEHFLTGARDRQRRDAEGAALVADGESKLTAKRSIDRELEVLTHQLNRAPKLTGHEPIEVKRARWALEDRAAELSKAARSAAAEAEARFLQAIERAPNHIRGRSHLADLHWQRYREARHDNDFERAQSEIRLVGRFHDGAYTARLRPKVSLTLNTTSPGAEVYRHPFIERDRVLVPDRGEYLGRTPLVRFPLPTGRQLLEIRHPDRPPVRLPLLAWQGDEIRLDVPLPRREILGSDFVFVPPGEFLRGHDPQAVLAAPSARVDLDAYAIGRFPITCAEYFEFLNALTPDEAAARAPRAGRPILGPEAQTGRWSLPVTDSDGDVWLPSWPIVNVSLRDAEAYARWRSARDGVTYRLPTDDEWEKAARGTDGRVFPWGDHFDPTFCNIRGSRPTCTVPEAVGMFPADESPYGVRDTAGGVREWTSSKLAGEQHSTRGGAWNLFAFFCRAAGRFGQRPNTTLSSLGFRLVKMLTFE